MSSQSFQETLVAAQVDGSALTAAAANSLLPAHSRITLPAGFFDKIGKALRIKATGQISNVVTTPGTARFDVRFNSLVVWDSLAIPLNTTAKTDRHWELEILLTARAIGATGNLIGWGKWCSESLIGAPAAAAGAPGCMQLPYNAAPAVGANFDTSAANALDLFFTQTVATGSCKLNQCIVESLN